MNDVSIGNIHTHTCIEVYMYTYIVVVFNCVVHNISDEHVCVPSKKCLQDKVHV